MAKHVISQLAHVELYSVDPEGSLRFFRDVLGLEEAGREGQSVHLRAWGEHHLACSSLSHDLALIQDASGGVGRLNHVAYWQDTREDVLRAADLLVDAGFQLEHGPTRHGATEAFFLYVFEPGGNRVEVYSGGYLNFAPDWGPIKWSF